MRLAITTFLIVFSVVAIGNIGARDDRKLADGGMSVEEFRDLADALPKLPGTIQAVLLFRAFDDRKLISAAITTFDEKKGWQLFIFHSPEGRKFQLEWQSGNLGDRFYVRDPSALKLFHLEEEDAVYFEGCAPHTCPDVFSIVLYVPSKRAAFTANYLRGKVTYSPPETGQMEEYKSVLDQLISERLEPWAPLKIK